MTATAQTAATLAVRQDRVIVIACPAGDQGGALQRCLDRVDGPLGQAGQVCQRLVPYPGSVAVGAAQVPAGGSPTWSGTRFSLGFPVTSG